MSRRAGFAAAAIAGAALAGCASPGRWPSAQTGPRTAAPPAAGPAAPATRIVRVYVPKPVRCVPEDIGPPPAYPDSDAALRDAGGAADRYQLLAAGRLLREQRLQRLEEVVKRCRNAAR
jgi:hypothetical protein